MMCMIKKPFVEGVYTWVPKKKKNDASRNNSTCSKNSVFERIKGEANPEGTREGLENI